jgi:8-oxo-dGTP pyrophosphatase MutT (NUDIX family)
MVMIGTQVRKGRTVKSRDEVSAGGVVYRRDGDKVEILVCKDAGYHRWVLPKGLVGKGESYEQAALREVQEETGIHARLVASLGEPEQYVYMARGVRVFKRVYYFLMEYESGSIATHDHEMEDVRWVSVDEALELLAYDGAKRMVTAARERIEKELKK